MDRQNEGIEDAAELRLILLDMGGLLPQSGGKQDWPSYRGKTFPLVYLSDPKIVQIPADKTLQDVHKLCLLSRNQIKPVSRILAISGILGHFQQKHLGRIIFMSMIKIENLTFSYPTSYDNVFENVSFQVDTDWKLGFVGRNGRGKTTFLNLLLGKYEYSGKILSSVQFDYFPYPVSDKNRITEDILQEICPLAEEWELMRELSYLDVDVDVLWRPFETLSNGEQTKVLIAALFLNEGHFLLIDEPTNHLDAKARKSVAAYLKKKKGFILVSHDRRFLDDCVDYILSINRANIEVQRGNFSSWMSNFERQQEFELAQNERLQKDIRRLQQSAKRAAVWSERVEASKIGAADKGYVGHKAAKMMKRSKSIEARQQQTIEQKSALLKNMETGEQTDCPIDAEAISQAIGK